MVEQRALAGPAQLTKNLVVPGAGVDLRQRPDNGTTRCVGSLGVYLRRLADDRREMDIVVEGGGSNVVVGPGGHPLLPAVVENTDLGTSRIVKIVAPGARHATGRNPFAL